MKPKDDKPNDYYQTDFWLKKWDGVVSALWVSTKVLIVIAVWLVVLIIFFGQIHHFFFTGLDGFLDFLGFTRNPSPY